MANRIVDFLRNQKHCLAILNMVPNISFWCLRRIAVACRLVCKSIINTRIPSQSLDLYSSFAERPEIREPFLVEIDARRMGSASVFAIDRSSSVNSRDLIDLRLATGVMNKQAVGCHLINMLIVNLQVEHPVHDRDWLNRHHFHR